MSEKQIMIDIPTLAVCVALAVITAAEYMRPSKQAERKATAQSQHERQTLSQAEKEQTIADRKTKEYEAKQAEEKAEREALTARYRNNNWRTEAEGYFFKGIKYANGDGVSPNWHKAVQNFQMARNLAGPNEIAMLDEMISSWKRTRAVGAWNHSKYDYGY